MIQYSVLGLAVAGGMVGLYYFGRSRVKRLQSRYAESEAMDPGAAAHFAKRLKMAFDNDGWWGTDEEAVYRVMREIPSRSHYHQVQRAYRRMYDRELNADLEDELDSREMGIVQEILALKEY